MHIVLGIPIYRCTKEACTALIDNENKLNELDRAGGDGDTGTTLGTGQKVSYYLSVVWGRVLEMHRRFSTVQINNYLMITIK